MSKNNNVKCSEFTHFEEMVQRTTSSKHTDVLDGQCSSVGGVCRSFGYFGNGGAAGTSGREGGDVT